MDDTTIWMGVGHFIGFTFWIAGLVATAALLRAHHAADVASRPGIVTSARAMAGLMEFGSLLAIGIGLWQAFASSKYAAFGTAFGSGGWLHLKLTIVVIGLIVPHAYLRIALKRARTEGAAVRPIGAWVIPVILIAAAATIAVVRGYILRK
jgi:uncharacterized membrane protein